MKISKLCLLAAILSPLSYGVTIDAGGDGGSLPLLIVDSSVPASLHQKVAASGVAKVREGICSDGARLTNREFVCVGFGSEDAYTVGIPTQKSTQKSGLTKADALQYTYGLLTGQPNSPYNSPLAMVAKKAGEYTLLVSDFMGGDRRVLHTSSSPLLSPSWSPSGRYLAYMSYEIGRATIFVHDVVADRRLVAYSERGLNGYPSFASEHELFVSVSDEKVNSDIVKIDLLTDKVSKVTTTSRPEIYPKKSLSGTAFLQMFGDLPYLFELIDGKAVKKHGVPLNAFDVSNKRDCWVGSSAKKLIISRNGSKSSLSFDKTVESPTVMSNCQFSYLVKDGDVGSYIVGFNVFNEQSIAIRLKGFDLIQVSAY